MKKWFTYLIFNLKGVRVQTTCWIDPKARLEYGSSFFGYTRITPDVSVGRYTYATDAIIQNAEIGSFCSIAPGVKIGLNNHPLDRLLTHPMGYPSAAHNKSLPRVVIGHDVWIGANAVVLGGLIIGDGAVIAAGAIVTKNVAPFSIVAGVPAREISKRSKHPDFDKLLQTRDDKELKELLTKNKDQVTSFHQQVI